MNEEPKVFSLRLGDNLLEPVVKPTFHLGFKNHGNRDD